MKDFKKGKEEKLREEFFGVADQFFESRAFLDERGPF
jgi:hypothetical protein